MAQNSCSESDLQNARLEQKQKKQYAAITILEKSIITHPNCLESFQLLAGLYYRINENNKAKNSIIKCIQIDTKKGTEHLYEMAKEMLEFGDEKLYIELIKEASKNTNLDRISFDSTSNNYLQQNTIKNNINSSIPINMGASINDVTMQTSPTISTDAKQIIFTTAVNKLNDDFMVSTFDTCTGWSQAIGLGYPPNTSYPERGGKISADGHYLFYTRCDNRSSNGWDGGGCDVLFSARIDDTTWDSPQKFGATINSPDYEADPCISIDNKTIYFVSDKAGGYGGKDIWKSKLERGLWQRPVNCGPNINTKGNETAPFIHADNESLYYVSDGKIGFGGNDFYLAKVQNDTFITPSINLGLPINNKNNQQSICVSMDGKTAFFAADTIVNGVSNFEIYHTKLANTIQPKFIRFIKGYVVDKFTKKQMPDTKIFLIDSNKKEIKFIRTNSGDGSFCIPLLHHQQLYLHLDSTEEYAEYNLLLNDNDKKLPNIIEMNLYIKQKNVLDTIYHASFSDDIASDTSLAFCKNNLKIWQQHPTDSIRYVATILRNISVDTSFAATVCFSENGYTEYQQYIENFRTKKQQEFDNYFAWYKKYLLGCGFTANQLYFEITDEITPFKKLFDLSINIIEYYP
jgi:WD40-like Beta Propeller Repeat